MTGGGWLVACVAGGWLVGLCWCAPSCVPSCLRSCVRFVVCSRVSWVLKFFFSSPACACLGLRQLAERLQPPARLALTLLRSLPQRSLCASSSERSVTVLFHTCYLRTSKHARQGTHAVSRRHAFAFSHGNSSRARLPRCKKLHRRRKSSPYTPRLKPRPPHNGAASEEGEHCSHHFSRSVRPLLGRFLASIIWFVFRETKNICASKKTYALSTLVSFQFFLCRLHVHV